MEKFIGFQRIHELTGDERNGKAAAFFWKSVVENRSWVNGGNSMHEHFTAPEKMGEAIPNDGEPETCNTYNMLKLTAALYREHPDPARVDYYENALFNHILTSQAPLAGAGGFVYYTPLRPGYARSYGKDFDSFWCCTGTGMENHAKYGDFIYARDKDALYVNLFMASEVEWQERGMTVRQETSFPDTGATTLVVTKAAAAPVAIRVRHPAWLAADHLDVQVNGAPLAVISQPGGHAEILRAWKPGDRIDIALPMDLRVVRQNNTPGWVSVFHGPILLAGELGGDGLSQADFIGPYTPAKAMLPKEKSPVFLAGTDAEILAKLQPLPGKPGVFQSTGLVKPADVTFVPFYKVHFQRYAIYWEQAGADELAARQEKIAAAEKAARALDERTIDSVRIGEQQPEIDHNLRFEKSASGNGPQELRWRDARDGGWFSYDLKLPGPDVKSALRVVYWGADAGREFDILADGKPLATQKLTGGKNACFAVEYPIDAGLTKDKEKITVRFQAKPGGFAGGVFGVRLVRAP